MTLTANWSYPTAIRFGAGRISELPEACAAAGIKNPLAGDRQGAGRSADHPVNLGYYGQSRSGPRDICRCRSKPE